jgi:membrane-bound metal-dependent hydrolase YbcI (DUF457 family)
MNTHSHALLGAVLFGKAVPKRAWFGLLGGITPDVPMILIVLTLMAFRVPANKIFDELYWQDWWQVTNAIGHSFLLWSGLLALGFFNRRQQNDRWTLLAIFAGSALLHAFIDFCVHREDAHMSFWPLSRYKFMSPISYYDPDHYGHIFSLFDSALGVFMTLLLARQFRNLLARAALALCFAAYVAFPIMLLLGERG